MKAAGLYVIIKTFSKISDSFLSTMKNNGRFLALVLLILFILGGCSPFTPKTPTEFPAITQAPIKPSSTPEPITTPTSQPEPVPQFIYYVDGNLGSDDNMGTEDQPWRTIQKVVDTVIAGDLVFIRGGQYEGTQFGWIFQNSGTQSQPITLKNFPGEQVVFSLSSVMDKDSEIFSCHIDPSQPDDWNTPKADYIRIIGTDVEPQILSNDVESKKGFVIQGREGEQSSGFISSDCDNWEIAGIDFVDVASGVFTFKNNYGGMEEFSTDNCMYTISRIHLLSRGGDAIQWG